MAGRKSQGTDFDALFDVDIIGDGPQASGYNANGIPIRYAHIQYGSKRPDVGYRVNGVDVSNLWAAKGTAVYVSSDALPASLVDYQVNSSGPVTSTVTFAYFRDGTTTFSPSTIGSNTWITHGSSSVGDDYDIRFSQVSGNSIGILTATLNAWMQINAARTVSLAVSRNQQGALTAFRTVKIEVRRRSDGVILSTETIYLEAQADIS